MSVRRKKTPFGICADFDSDESSIVCFWFANPLSSLVFILLLFSICCCCCCCLFYSLELFGSRFFRFSMHFVCGESPPSPTTTTTTATMKATKNGQIFSTNRNQQGEHQRLFVDSNSIYNVWKKTLYKNILAVKSVSWKLRLWERAKKKMKKKSARTHKNFQQPFCCAKIEPTLGPL